MYFSSCAYLTKGLILPDSPNNRTCLSEPQSFKMSAGVAGVQEKLNKSLNQKGMVSAHFLYDIISRSRCMDKFPRCPALVVGHINKFCQLEGLKGRFGKMIGKKGSSTDCQGEVVTTREEVKSNF